MSESESAQQLMEAVISTFAINGNRVGRVIWSGRDGEKPFKHLAGGLPSYVHKGMEQRITKFEGIEAIYKLDLLTEQVREGMIREATELETLRKRFYGDGAPLVVSLVDVKSRATEYVWGYRLPLNDLTLIAGNPGVGKSWIVADLIARLTTGRPLPGEHESTKREPYRVLLLAERSLDRVLKPRIEHLGGNLELIDVPDAVGYGDPVEVLKHGYSRIEKITLDHLQKVREIIDRYNPDFFFIDPIAAFTRVDLNKAENARKVYDGLMNLANESSTTVAAIHHLTKAAQLKASQRVPGSVQQVGVVSSLLLVLEHPEQKDVCVVCHDKANVGPKSPSIIYRLEDTEIMLADKKSPFKKIVWGEETNLTADDISRLELAKFAAAQKAHVPRPLTKKESARQLLREALAGGPKPSNEIKGKAGAIGISDETLRDAADEEGIERFQKDGQWWMRLPQVRVSI
jgi:AAA domain